MARSFANAIEAYSLDTGVLSNLDGLASTTTFERHNQGEEAMEVNKVEDDKCYKCQPKGPLC